MKVVFTLFVLLSFMSCKQLPNYDNHDIKKIRYYIGLPLNGVSDGFVFEHSPPDYLYPKSVYISFLYENPQNLIDELGLIPSSSSLNNDSSRRQDYINSKYHSNFWKMQTTIQNATIDDIERTKLLWWKPDLNASRKTYGGFYNERTQHKIVNSKYQSWTGRMVFQNLGDRVYIQIDLLESK